MPTKKVLKKKGYKIMFNGSNCDRKSQLSGILTGTFNPRDSKIETLLYDYYISFKLLIHDKIKQFS